MVRKHVLPSTVSLVSEAGGLTPSTGPNEYHPLCTEDWDVALLNERSLPKNVKSWSIFIVNSKNRTILINVKIVLLHS